MTAVTLSRTPRVPFSVQRGQAPRRPHRLSVVTGDQEIPGPGTRVGAGIGSSRAEAAVFVDSISIHPQSHLAHDLQHGSPETNHETVRWPACPTNRRLPKPTDADPDGWRSWSEYRTIEYVHCTSKLGDVAVVQRLCCFRSRLLNS